MLGFSVVVPEEVSGMVVVSVVSVVLEVLEVLLVDGVKVPVAVVTAKVSVEQKPTAAASARVKTAANVLFDEVFVLVSIKCLSSVYF